MIRGPHLLGPEGFAFAPHLSIGEVWTALRVDGSKAKADAVKAGGDAGTAAAKSMGDKIKTGMKVVGVAIGGAMSVALVSRFAQLERATASFRAETGATAAEAEKAGKAINDMAGRNMQPVEEIGNTLTKVVTDLGLTGDEAAKTAEQFLRFGRATGQDASQAVLAFDDILDSWNLTAADAQGLMDKLVVSHQKYGGTIEDNERTLAALAPSMRAANMQIDDAIGLLNLFGAKGLDANTASAAFSKALTKVKSPAELQKLIDDISATEDPFKRAAKAADLFGARAGAKLANALGGAHIKDYNVSLEDSVGATDRAADASLTMVDRIQLAFKGFISGTVDLLGPAGPLLTAVGSLGTLFAPALAKAWGSIVKSGAVKTAIGAAGAAAGVIYTGAEAVVGAFVSGMSALWGKLAGTSAYKVAVAAAGAASGVIFAGTQAGVGFLGALTTALIRGMKAIPIPITLLPLALVGSQGDQIKAGDPKFDAYFKRLTREMQLKAIELMRQSGDEAGAAYYEAMMAGMAAAAQKPDWHAAIAPFLANARKAGEEAAKNLGDGVEGGFKQDETGRTTFFGNAGKDAGETYAHGIDQGIKLGRDGVWHSIGDVTDGMVRLMKAAGQEIVDHMRITAVNMKDTIKSGKAGIIEQFRDLAWQEKHPWAEGEYEEWLAKKHRQALRNAKKADAEGMPQIAAQWRAVADEIKASMDALPTNALVNAQKTLTALSPVQKAIANALSKLPLVGGAFGLAGLFPHAAGGGYHSGWTWTGEKGPELVNLPAGSYVHDAVSSAAMANQGAGRIDLYLHDDGGNVTDLSAMLARAITGASESANIRYLRPRGA